MCPMIKVAICDDEESVCEQIRKKLLQLHPDWYVDVYLQGQKLLEGLKKASYQVLFLDIELGDSNGYEISKQLRAGNSNAVVIFISSYEEYACEAFEVDALRFLKKPFDEDKLEEAICKAAHVVEQQNVYYVYHKRGWYFQVRISNICYVEKKQRNLELHLASGKVQTLSGSLREIEKELPDMIFAQCHQGYLVNLSYVKSILESLVIMENGDKLPLSRGKKEGFRNRYMDYCWEQEERSDR